MTQEEKQLLFKDLSARFPYGVICTVWFKDSEGWKNEDMKLSGLFNDSSQQFFTNTNGSAYSDEFIPYLRPMSSMTEEEKEEIEVFIFNEWYQEDSCKIDNEGWIEILANYDVSGIDPCFCSDYVDWLNAHHFDYRGLIEKGLALEAPEGMYNNNIK